MGTVSLGTHANSSRLNDAGLSVLPTQLTRPAAGTASRPEDAFSNCGARELRRECGKRRCGDEEERLRRLCYVTCYAEGSQTAAASPVLGHTSVCHFLGPGCRV